MLIYGVLPWKTEVALVIIIKLACYLEITTIIPAIAYCVLFAMRWRTKWALWYAPLRIWSWPQWVPIMSFNLYGYTENYLCWSQKSVLKLDIQLALIIFSMFLIRVIPYYFVIVFVFFRDSCRDKHYMKIVCFEEMYTFLIHFFLFKTVLDVVKIVDYFFTTRVNKYRTLHCISNKL